ncbi:lipid-A-disaccharide synthase [Hyphobacterium sp. HN65]|uniref:Lipid-A-disaccharide synthase n=1 Tax=Hyphobacterium lacteum TaxID=3116575 RepID=A0ABU7LLV2_9PROT|nr:lipid-A-disaccharide synthase [Hyphobacterium sp. HN65]MEE2524905.1 lipid-A-disaccharide synthase [Hyphobacterium sp. HN65]
MSEPLKVFLVAVEPSGDALGADLIAALRESCGNDVSIAGVGGPRMAELGVRSAVDISGLAILGLLDGLKTYPQILKKVNETVEAAMAFEADSVVLIDSWGFMIRVAQRLQKRENAPFLIKYVGPQIWAARPRRANVLAQSVDHLLTIHAFDQPMFEAAGLATTFVGNPALERPVTGDGTAFRRKHGIDKGTIVIGVLFGSRPSELRRIGPAIRDAIAALQAQLPGAVFVTPAAPAIAEGVRAALNEDPRMTNVLVVEEDEKRDATSAMNVALAVSGTATTELALAGVPTVSTYRLGWLSYWIYKNILFKAKYFSLVNIAADQELIIEHAQDEANGERLAASVQVLLDENSSGRSRGPALQAAAEAMKGDGRSSARAAEAVHGLTAARKRPD